MKKNLLMILTVAVICFLYSSPTHAIVGAGFHWGFDFSLDMEDTFDDPLAFDFITPVDLIDPSSLGLSISEIDDLLPGDITYDSLKILINEHLDVLEARAPLTLSRKDWARSIINMGGKVFIDDIRIIDAVELSFNIGAWEYEAVLKYPTGEMQEDITPEDVQDFVETGDYEKILKMDEAPLTLDAMGLSYLKIFGISKTPYTKMHFGLSIRKNLVAKPDKSKLFKLYLGGGVNLHLGTPVITPNFVEDIIKSSIESAGNNINEMNTSVSDDLLNDVLEKLINEGKNPTFGMHILLGIMAKLPVIPLGFYGDAKFMIPFGDIDDNVDLRGYGFLVNTGISLSF